MYVHTYSFIHCHTNACRYVCTLDCLEVTDMQVPSDYDWIHGYDVAVRDVKYGPNHPKPTLSKRYTLNQT